MPSIGILKLTGSLLAATGSTASIIFGAWIVLVGFGLVRGAAGWFAAVLSLALFPAMIVGVPVYAGWALGESGPAVLAGGVFLGLWWAGAGDDLRRRVLGVSMGRRVAGVVGCLWIGYMAVGLGLRAAGFLVSIPFWKIPREEIPYYVPWVYLASIAFQSATWVYVLRRIAKPLASRPRAKRKIRATRVLGGVAAVILLLLLASLNLRVALVAGPDTVMWIDEQGGQYFAESCRDLAEAAAQARGSTLTRARPRDVQERTSTKLRPNRDCVDRGAFAEDGGSFFWYFVMRPFLRPER